MSSNKSLTFAFDSSTNYTTFLSYIDMYRENPYLSNIVEYKSFRTKTSQLIETQDEQLLSKFYFTDLSNAVENSYLELNSHFGELNAISDKFVNNLSTIILPKNDPVKILNFSPNFRGIEDFLTDIEFLYPSDSTDYQFYIEQDIATPDSKLYYPEPFIASPSFNHEEI